MTGDSDAGRPRRRWQAAAAAVLIAGLAVWWWWTAPHRELAAELDRIDLPPGLTLVGTYTSGDRTCFFDSCPRLRRYYASDLSPGELCRLVGTEVAEADGPVEWLEGCTYETPMGAFLSVEGPIDEVPPIDNELISTRPVDVAHRSILELMIRR